MNNVKTILIGVIFAGALFLGIGVYLIANPNRTSSVNNSENVSKTISIQANREGWQRIGTGKFTIEVRGTINYGGADRSVTTDSTTNLGAYNALVPGIPFGVLVGKIGQDGVPFQVHSYYKFNTDKDVYIAVNDSNYRDNTGSYVIEIESK